MSQADDTLSISVKRIQREEEKKSLFNKAYCRSCKCSQQYFI